MDELIRRKLFKPYRKLNKQSYRSQQSSEINFERLFILHEGKSPTLAYFESAIISRFPDAECHFIDTLASTDILFLEDLPLSSLDSSPQNGNST